MKTVDLKILSLDEPKDEFSDPELGEIKLFMIVNPSHVHKEKENSSIIV